MNSIEQDFADLVTCSMFPVVENSCVITLITIEICNYADTAGRLRPYLYISRCILVGVIPSNTAASFWLGD